MIRKLFLAVLLAAAGLAITLFLVSQFHALFKDIKGLQGQQQTHHRARGHDATARIYAHPRAYRAATSTATTGGVPWLVVLWAGTGVLMVVVLPGVVVSRRLRARRSRRYAYYEIVHSMHDEAFTRDVEDGMEALAHAIRETPGRRLLHGQGHISWIMTKMLIDGEPDFKILLELEPRHAKTVDAVLASVWPDVRLGHGHTGDPVPLSRGGLIEPGRLLRYRKQRPFYYALTPMAETGREFRAPSEAIGKMLTSTPGDYAIVRLQLTPMLQWLEGFARWRAHREQNRVERGSLWGLADAGLKDTVRHEEFTQTARRVVDSSLFSLEAQVAAPTLKDALRVGAALSAPRGSNRLHRRVMVVRERLYKRRFTRAQGPLFPTLSGRSLVSSREIAHLVELPTARMKNVPLHRLPLPRVPMPPEVMRIEHKTPMRTPPPSAAASTNGAPTTTANGGAGVGGDGVGASNGNGPENGAPKPAWVPDEEFFDALYADAEGDGP